MWPMLNIKTFTEINFSIFTATNFFEGISQFSHLQLQTVGSNHIKMTENNTENNNLLFKFLQEFTVKICAITRELRQGTLTAHKFILNLVHASKVCKMF